MPTTWNPDSQAKVNGIWKNGKFYVRINDEWLTAKSAWVKENDVWTKVYAGLDIEIGLFADWIEVDPTTVIDGSEFKVSFTDLEKGTNCYLYKDYGADYFSDFTIRYECEMYDATNRMVLDWFSMGNSTYGSYTDHEDANDGFSVHYWNNLNSTVWFVLRNHTTGSQTYGSWVRSNGVLEKVYCELVQSGNDIYHYVYQDSDYSVLLPGSSQVNPQTASITSFTGRYLSTAATIESESSIYATGYIQNLQIVTP